MIKTSKTVRGWGLRQANGHVRSEGLSRAGVERLAGVLAGQWMLWPTKRKAAAEAVKDEVPVRVTVMYLTEGWPNA